MKKIDPIKANFDMSIRTTIFKDKINELVEAHNELVNRFAGAKKELDKAEKDMCTSKALSNIKFPLKLGGIKKKGKK